MISNVFNFLVVFVCLVVSSLDSQFLVVKVLKNVIFYFLFILYFYYDKILQLKTVHQLIQLLTIRSMFLSLKSIFYCHYCKTILQITLLLQQCKQIQRRHFHLILNFFFQFVDLLLFVVLKFYYCSLRIKCFSVLRLPKNFICNFDLFIFPFQLLHTDPLNISNNE